MLKEMYKDNFSLKKTGIISEKGDWPNKAPLGYLNDGKGGISIDEERAKYIKRAFELYAMGNKSVKEIADILYSEGLKSRGGYKYHKSKLHNLLKNSFYIGIMVFNDGTKYLGNHTPIISQELYNQVEKVINKKHHSKKNHDFIFRGYLICHKCGCAYTASFKRQKHIYYYCTNGKDKSEEHKSYLKEQDTTNLIADMFGNLKYEKEMIDLCHEAEKEKIKDNSDYTEKAMNNLTSQLKTTETRLSALLDTLLDKTITKEVYAQKEKLLNNETVRIKKQINDFEAKNTANRKITLEQVKNIFLASNKAKKQFLISNKEEKQKALNTLLWKASIENKKIANFSFNMPYEILGKATLKSDFLKMRRERDSNPRRAFTLTSLAGTRFQPLSHLSFFLKYVIFATI